MQTATTDRIFRKETTNFAILMAFGITFLMKSAGYYFEAVRFDLDPPQTLSYEIERSKVINFGTVSGINDYLKVDVELLNKVKPHNNRTISIPITPQFQQIHNDAELDLYYQKLERKSLNGKSLWRIQRADLTIVDERQMSNFLRSKRQANLITAWFTGTIGVALATSAYIYFRRTKTRK